MNDTVRALAVLLAHQEGKPFTAPRHRKDADRLTRYARSLHTYAERVCNDPGITERAHGRAATHEENATEILGSYGLTANVSRDPRGHCLKLAERPDSWPWIDWGGFAYIPTK